MKVLVTGGSGFIGSHIAESLSKNGYETVMLDIEEPKWKIPAEIKFIKGDIRNIDLLKRITEKVDYIFHEAALVSIIESMQKPQETIEVNLTGSLNILKMALTNNTEKVIFASSCAIYGDNPNLPINEDELPNPKSPYAISKLSAEYFLKMFYDEYGLKITSLRYFNVYGSRQKHDSPYSAVIPIFIDRAIKNMPLEIYGDGYQTRDFIYIDDVVDANILAMKKGDGEIYNVGAGKNITIKELAEQIIEITDSKSEITYGAPRSGDIRHSLSDILKIKRSGFTPKVDLTNGLKQIINSKN